jgi:hypothetical protein
MYVFKVTLYEKPADFPGFNPSQVEAVDQTVDQPYLRYDVILISLAVHD